MTTLRTFSASFASGKKILETFLIDAAGWAIIVYFLTLFNTLMQGKVHALTGGRSVEELKTALLAQTIENSDAFLRNVQAFTYFFIIGSVLLVVLVLLAYSLAQQFIWSRLTAKPFRPSWKWLGLTLGQLLLLLPYSLIYALLRIIINLLPLQNPTVFTALSKGSSFLFLLGFLLYSYVASFSLAQNQQVWEALGKGFQGIKSRWSSVGKLFLLATVVALVLNVLLWLIQRLLLPTPTIFTLLGAAALLLYLAWLRAYLLQVVQEGG